MLEADNSVDIFVLLCILAGSDYYEKALVSHQFGFKPIHEALNASWDHESSLRVALTTEDREVWLEAMFIFVYGLYYKVCSPSLVPLPQGTSSSQEWMSENLAQIRGKVKGAKFKPPDMPKLQEAADQASFNWRYWLNPNADRRL